jgi:predicted RNase H-like nuclease
MKRPSKNEWLAGVDGCSGGWIVVFARGDDEFLPPRKVDNFAEIVLSKEKPSIVAVDVPIGLPDCSPVGGRRPEPEIRPLLGRRASSVFRVPSRCAVYSSLDAQLKVVRQQYRQACKVARATSKDEKAFSLQSFYIFDKIASVDNFLRSSKRHKDRIYETHPELAFYYMNGKAPLCYPKASDEGLKERRHLLATGGIPKHIISLDPPSGAKRDDLLDALAGVVVARRIKNNLARAHPASFCKDEFDLPMAIWA